MIDMECEYKNTGWHDVECTCDGKFRRNGRNLSTRVYYGCSPAIIIKVKGCKPKQKSANILVAMAWHPEYKEGYCIIPKDGNQNNIHIDNLHVADAYEFASYKAERRKNPEAGAVDWNKYGVFKKTPIDGLECTIDGVFRRNNRIVPLREGKRARWREGLLYIHYTLDGEATTTTAARLVAQTWSPDIWDEDSIVSYKDGNPKNIHSDNLILVDARKYYAERGYMLGKGNMCDFKRAREIVERKAKEARIALNYFDTGSVEEFNNYVQSYLTGYLSDYFDSYGYRPSLKRYVLSEVLSILYDWVLSNRPLVSYSFFCKKLIRT